jgi:hypothetical protein
VEALDADCTWQPPVPPVQPAVPSEVRGFPPATPPSQAAVLVRTEPEQEAPGWQARPALDDEVDEGPLSDWPGSGLPVLGSTATWSGALEAAERVSPAQRPPVTVHSALDEVPRACGVTAVSRALDDFAVPPHSVAAPEHATDAAAFDTLTGPDTGVTPAVVAAAAASAGSRSATVVSAEVVQLPPAPWAVQDEEPMLSRTPLTSPDAPPEVVLDPAPVHVAVRQESSEPAVLEAASSRTASVVPFTAAVTRSGHEGSVAPSLTLSLTCELDSAAHPPPFALQFEEALVVRTGASAPFPAGVPTAVPVVALFAAPLHGPPPQSTFAPAELNAVASPSVREAVRAVPSCSSTGLSTSVLL